MVVNLGAAKLLNSIHLLLNLSWQNVLLNSKIQKRKQIIFRINAVHGCQLWPLRSKVLAPYLLGSGISTMGLNPRSPENPTIKLILLALAHGYVKKLYEECCQSFWCHRCLLSSTDIQKAITVAHLTNSIFVKIDRWRSWGINTGGGSHHSGLPSWCVGLRS